MLRPQRTRRCRAPVIRVLHLINTLAPGGAESLVTDLCARLPSEDIEPTVAYVFGDGSLAGTLENRGIRVERLSRGNRPSPVSLFRLLRLIRARKIEIIHVHLVYAGIIGKIAARLLGVPVVMTRHWVSDPRHGTLLYRLDDWLTRRYATVLIAAGEQVRAAIFRENWMPPERVVLQRNAIGVSAFEKKVHRPAADGRYTVGTVGRMEAPKAQDVFLRAMVRIREGLPGARGVIAGDGRMREQLEELRSRLGLNDAVDFLGAVPRHNVPDLLSSLDVFVLTSSWEGLPMALIEAAASGLPVVATDVGGVREVVQDGLNGFLVPSGDWQQIAAKVLLLLNDTEMRAAFGAQARGRAKAEFDIARLARDTADLYRRILRPEL